MRNDFLVSINREIIYVDIYRARLTRLWITLPPVPLLRLFNNLSTNHSDDANAVVDEPMPSVSAPTASDGQDDGDVPMVQVLTTPPRLDSNPIVQMAVSHDSRLLAVATAGEKALYLYRVVGELKREAELLSRRELARTSTVVKFSNKDDLVFVADKSGDVYTYGCVNEQWNDPAKWLLAHFSMVLDLTQTPCSRFVITSDRDEKIRVTTFPYTSEIHTYCLGHKEYVAAVQPMPIFGESTIISASGDKTLRAWNYLTGKLCETVRLPAPVLHMTARQMGKIIHIAVSFANHDTTMEVYRVFGVTNFYSFALMTTRKVPNVKGVTGLMFDRLGELLMTTITKEDKVQVLRFTYEGTYTLADEDTVALNKAIARVATTMDGKYNKEDVDLLFKKKFENVEKYQERKELRMAKRNKRKRDDTEPELVFPHRALIL